MSKERVEAQEFFNYINNFQKEIQRLNTEIDYLNGLREEENKDLQNLQQKIERAINYIKGDFKIKEYSKNNLLEILGDKENE